MSTPNQTELEARISVLSTCYEKMTGLSLQHRGVCNPWAETWANWINAGFTLQDLDLVLRHQNHGIRTGERKRACQRFTRLIGDVIYFAEELAFAQEAQRAFERKPPAQTPRDKVLAQVRPVVSEPKAPGEAKPLSYWIQKLKEAAQCI